MSNPYSAAIGSEVVLSPNSRHPETVTILSRRDEPNSGTNRLVRIEQADGKKYTHEVRPDGSISYWNRNDE